ncbi:hypothetical protein DL98DRAFT_529167 [Cadophora sp. DSE1049]|nr:hypothetical protein DL98DRAFT_529167 [Cadophora sp. DSE1049]
MSDTCGTKNNVLVQILTNSKVLLSHPHTSVIIQVSNRPTLAKLTAAINKIIQGKEYGIEVLADSDHATKVLQMEWSVYWDIKGAEAYSKLRNDDDVRVGVDMMRARGWKDMLVVDIVLSKDEVDGDVDVNVAVAVEDCAMPEVGAIWCVGGIVGFVCLLRGLAYLKRVSGFEMGK